MLKQLLHKKSKLPKIDDCESNTVSCSTQTDNDTFENNIVFEATNMNTKIKLERISLDEKFFKNCQNWTKNRPPDNIRINDIVKYYYISDQSTYLVPGIIYAWKNSEINNDCIIIYDGIHRLLAAKEYIKQTKRKLYCLLQTTTTDDEQQIINDFVNLNKSVCVPTIFLDDTDIRKKLMCQSIVNILCERYPTFVSPSRRPFSYNFNRDNLVEFISTLNINFHINNIDTKVINEMTGLNYEARYFVDRHNIKYPNKCLYHNFFLFFLDKSFIKQKIEDAINN